MFKQFIKWLLVSSANPESVSLTVKGLLLSIVPWIMGFLQLVPIVTNTSTQSAITLFFIDISTWVKGILMVIGASIAVYGFVRKLILTHAITTYTPVELQS